MRRLQANVEKAWHMSGPREAATFDVHGFNPHYYVYRSGRDSGSPDRAWVHLLGDCRVYGGNTPEVQLADGTTLFHYVTSTGNLSRLVDDAKCGRCFLLKEDRSLWQVVEFEFDASRQQPAFVLVRRRDLHQKGEVNQVAFGEGPDDVLTKMAQQLLDADLSWAARESHIAKAELERRTYKPSGGGGERDALTDLWTRGRMDSYLQEVQQRAAAFPLAMIFADIDHFKRVNDSRGHDAGDQALRAVASQLTRFAYPNGLAFRYGGEELLLVRETCDLETAKGIAERLRRAVAGMHVPDASGEFSVTVSVGVSCATASSDVEAARKRADEAMYEAKAGGRDRVAAK